MRNDRKSDDIPVLAAWLLWEMFFGDDGGKGNVAPPGGERPVKGDPQPPPAPGSSKRK